MNKMLSSAKDIASNMFLGDETLTIRMANPDRDKYAANSENPYRLGECLFNFGGPYTLKLTRVPESRPGNEKGTVSIRDLSAEDLIANGILYAPIDTPFTREELQTPEGLNRAHHFLACNMMSYYHPDNGYAFSLPEAALDEYLNLQQLWASDFLRPEHEELRKSFDGILDTQVYAIGFEPPAISDDLKKIRDHLKASIYDTNTGIGIFQDPPLYHIEFDAEHLLPGDIRLTLRIGYDNGHVQQGDFTRFKRALDDNSLDVNSKVGNPISMAIHEGGETFFPQSLDSLEITVEGSVQQILQKTKAILEKVQAQKDPTLPSQRYSGSAAERF